jgi:hypothetical protein
VSAAEERVAADKLRCASRAADQNRRVHGQSDAVKRFASVLYPNCLAPVEFIEYKQIDANAALRRV